MSYFIDIYSFLWDAGTEVSEWNAALHRCHCICPHQPINKKPCLNALPSALLVYRGASAT